MVTLLPIVLYPLDNLARAGSKNSEETLFILKASIYYNFCPGALQYTTPPLKKNLLRG